MDLIKTRVPSSGADKALCSRALVCSGFDPARSQPQPRMGCLGLPQAWIWALGWGAQNPSDLTTGRPGGLTADRKDFENLENLENDDQKWK